MKNVFVIVLISIFLASCQTVSSTGGFGFSPPNSIVLDGEEITPEIMGVFTSWRCRDFVYETGTVVEVGVYGNPLFNSIGFILFDGTQEGVATAYSRQGLSRRWDWGANDDGGFDFTMVVEADGIGRYYDFSAVESGNPASASDVFRCKKSN